VASHRLQGRYQLHESFPYIGAQEFSALTKTGARDIGINAIIAATPPNLHHSDAILAAEYGIHAFIEKPAYPPASSGNPKKVITTLFKQGRIDLIDCFLGNRALREFLDKSDYFLSGAFNKNSEPLGAIRFIHSTCVEPHSVSEEGSRAARLMDSKVQGGFLYADMAPHPLAATEVILNKVLNLSLSSSRIVGTYRARELAVDGPDEAETAAAVLRVIDYSAGSDLIAAPGIELLSIAGKGLKISGGAKDEPLPHYMVTIGCEEGWIDICLGDAQKTIPSYICVTPKDVDKQAKMLVYRNSGLGYCSILADLAMQAQSRLRASPGEDDSVARLALDRIALQSQASVAATQAIEEVYTSVWQNQSRGIQRYDPSSLISEATLPPEIPLACRIHPHVPLDPTRALAYAVLRRKD
jgi:hypothetical protein